jgi:hypothetical protein
MGNQEASGGLDRRGPMRPEMDPWDPFQVGRSWGKKVDFTSLCLPTCKPYASPGHEDGGAMDRELD